VSLSGLDKRSPQRKLSCQHAGNRVERRAHVPPPPERVALLDTVRQQHQRRASSLHRSLGDESPRPSRRMRNNFELGSDRKSVLPAATSCGPACCCIVIEPSGCRCQTRRRSSRPSSRFPDAPLVRPQMYRAARRLSPTIQFRAMMSSLRDLFGGVAVRPADGAAARSSGTNCDNNKQVDILRASRELAPQPLVNPARPSRLLVCHQCVTKVKQWPPRGPNIPL
jgi:hypothetical protein